MLVSAVAHLGPQWVTLHVPVLVPLWEAALNPPPTAKSPKGSADDALAHALRLRHAALRSLGAFLRLCPGLLSAETVANAAQWLEGSLQSVVGEKGVQMRLPVLPQQAVKAALFEAVAHFPWTLLPQRSAFLSSVTQACFAVCGPWAVCGFGAVHE